MAKSKPAKFARYLPSDVLEYLEAKELSSGEIAWIEEMLGNEMPAYYAYLVIIGLRFIKEKKNENEK